MVTKAKANIQLEPLGDRIVVRPIEREEISKGGVILPDTAKEKPQEGEVIALGPGKLTETGKRLDLDIKKGDIIIYAKYAGTEVEVDNEKMLIMREGDVLAIKR